MRSAKSFDGSRESHLARHAAQSFERAVALHQKGKLAEARIIYQKILRIIPNHFDSLNLSGLIAWQTGNPDQAIRLLGAAININPKAASAYNYLGNALQDLSRREEAVASYDKALSLNPTYAEAHNNRGNALAILKRLEDAVVSYERALSINPKYPEAYCNLGNALRGCKRMHEAIASYDKALSLQPDHAQVYFNRGLALMDLRRVDEALACFDKALSLKSDYLEAHVGRGDALFEIKRYQQARAAYERALAIDSTTSSAMFGIAHVKQVLCDWRGYEGDRKRLLEIVASGATTQPFMMRTISSSLNDLRAAALASNAALPTHGLPRFVAKGSPPGERLRIGYLSSDIKTHPVGRLMADVLDKYDHRQFSIHGYSTGSDDGSALRSRLIRAFDHFVDLEAHSDADAARRINEDGIDILVDLNGCTAGQRPRILASRPAPLQVSMLSYLGPTAASFIDYLVADPIVVPPSHQPWYDERVVYLRHCYLPATRVPKPVEIPSRRDFGLPEGAFVYCNFNSSYKITPEVFGAWMRILKAVPNSVLWLLAGNDTEVSTNLRTEAASRGISPDRLVFAPSISVDAYLARFRHADLFLDTLPCGACTVGRDALSVGLPILTCTGQVFSGRHATSLLHAAGMPELITQNLLDYEAAAVRLANEPGQLRTLRALLEANDATRQLFDISGFVRDLEEIFRHMDEIRRRGEPPRAFSLSPFRSA